jgi:hypothetical protein
MNHQDGMELEPDRTRLNVAHAGQKKSGKQFAIGKPMLDALGDLFDGAIARSVFQQPNQWLDFRVQTDTLRVDLDFRRRQRPQLPKKTETACPGDSSGSRRDFQKLASFHKAN